jgi:transcriptional regulator with XRE-family HTH domain
MTPAAFRTALESLGLTPAEASRLLGVQNSTIWRWMKGDRPIPKTVELVLELMIERKNQMIYAAYDDLSIYALGRSPEEAIANARRDANEPEAEFRTARVADALAQEIDLNGWNGNHRILASCHDGMTV